MFTVITFFLVLSVLVLIHESGHYFAAKFNKVRVEEFGFGLPPRLFGIKVGETLYSLNLLPFGGFVKVFGEDFAEVSNRKLSSHEENASFAHKKPWQKLMILVAGVTLNFVLGWGIVTYLFTQGVPVPSGAVHVNEIAKNSPAENSGLKAGDTLLKVITPDGAQHELKTTTDLTKLAAQYTEQALAIEASRNNHTFTTTLIPRKNPPKGQGALGVVITSFTIKKYPLYQAPWYGLIESAKITGMIARELGTAFFRFVTFQKAQSEITGPIGIAKLTSEAAHQGINALLQLVGLLSLNLAVLNILPFPALDGGRVAFVLYEWVTGRRVNPNIEQRMNFAGFAILISLLVLVTVNDVIKIFH